MTIAIMQARMGSTRLPKKVLKKIQGKTLLELYVTRVRPCKNVDKLVIATTQKPEDDVICRLAKTLHIDCFRGSENDLIDRYYQCAKSYHADVVVRITPDDPFVDYEIVDYGIQIFLDNDVDFVTNHFEPTYPEGLDVEIYSFKTLEKIWKDAKLLSEREHCFPYVLNNRKIFKIINFKQEVDCSHLRWTIDHECDFEMTKRIYDHLYDKDGIFLQRDILALLKEYPEIEHINGSIGRKEGFQRTLQRESSGS